MTQRINHTTTINNTAHVTAKRNAVVRYYASPPVHLVHKKKREVYNPYLKKIHPRVPHSKLATWPRK